MYDAWFKGSVQYEYDYRIEEYNWPLIFGMFLGFYCLALVLAKRFVAEPGPRIQY
jgi:hypothetical protein